MDPCANQFLGRMHADWFKNHSNLAQHDASEFAGWFRQQLLEKTLPQYMQAGWSARLLSSIEDQAAIFAPVPMACPVEGFITLQQLVSNWHHQEPFVHSFSCDSPWICIQVFRLPSIGQKSRCLVDWDRCTPLQLPIFSDHRGVHVEWHDFVVTTGVIHLGNAPTEGHYRGILWHRSKQARAPRFGSEDRTRLLESNLNPSDRYERSKKLLGALLAFLLVARNY